MDSCLTLGRGEKAARRGTDIAIITIEAQAAQEVCMWGYRFSTLSHSGLVSVLGNEKKVSVRTWVAKSNSRAMILPVVTGRANSLLRAVLRVSMLSGWKLGFLSGGTNERQGH